MQWEEEKSENGMRERERKKWLFHEYYNQNNFDCYSDFSSFRDTHIHIHTQTHTSVLLQCLLIAFVYKHTIREQEKEPLEFLGLC